MFLSQRRINVVWFGLFPGAKKKVKRKLTICWIFHLWILQITDHLLIRRVGISACGSIPLNILNKKTKTKINKWIETVYAACCTYPWPHVQDEACVTESNHPPAHTCICAHSHQVVKVECWHINLETFSLGKRMKTLPCQEVTGIQNCKNASRDVEKHIYRVDWSPLLWAHRRKAQTVHTRHAFCIEMVSFCQESDRYLSPANKRRSHSTHTYNLWWHLLEHCQNTTRTLDSVREVQTPRLFRARGLNCHVGPLRRRAL